VAKRINLKLSARYYDPSQIISHVGEVAYKLLLPKTARVHPVFHVSQLKIAIGNHSIESKLPQGLEVEDTASVEPESMLATRETQKNGNKLTEWLILWQFKPIE